MHGGRWNAPGSFETIYSGLTVATAVAESEAQGRYYGLDLADVWPRTFVAVDVRLHTVLDLTQGSIRQVLRVAAQRMREDDWRKLNDGPDEESLTHALGRAAFEAGLEGLTVRACDGGRNLVWFAGNLLPESKIAIRNQRTLL